MDYIAGVSEQCVETFLNLFPQFKNKVTVIENILSKDFIEKQSNLFDVSGEMQSDSIKLLSVGRFCEAKNFDNVPEIASIMKAKGIDFKWYLIGYGSDEALIKSKIAEYNISDTVIILGKKDNPYPYIKACDIYVQPSRYEGKCVAVREAQILDKPVVITNYTTAQSQLNDGFDGAIVPMDNAGCANALADFILDKDKQNRFISNMKTMDYSNQNEVEKIYKIIGD